MKNYIVISRGPKISRARFFVAASFVFFAAFLAVPKGKAYVVEFANRTPDRFYLEVYNSDPSPDVLDLFPFAGFVEPWQTVKFTVHHSPNWRAVMGDEYDDQALGFLGYGGIPPYTVFYVQTYEGGYTDLRVSSAVQNPALVASASAALTVPEQMELFLAGAAFIAPFLIVSAVLRYARRGAKEGVA